MHGPAGRAARPLRGSLPWDVQVTSSASSSTHVSTLPGRARAGAHHGVPSSHRTPAFLPTISPGSARAEGRVSGRAASGIPVRKPPPVERRPSGLWENAIRPSRPPGGSTAGLAGPSGIRRGASRPSPSRSVRVGGSLSRSPAAAAAGPAVASVARGHGTSSVRRLHGSEHRPTPPVSSFSRKSTVSRASASHAGGRNNNDDDDDGGEGSSDARGRSRAHAAATSSSSSSSLSREWDRASSEVSSASPTNTSRSSSSSPTRVRQVDDDDDDDRRRKHRLNHRRGHHRDTHDGGDTVAGSARASGKLAGLTAAAGLTNLGNTCFMNSVLQCLAHTPELVDAVATAPATGDRLVESFKSLVRTMWRRTSAGGGRAASVSPTQFKQEIGRRAPYFAGYQQHDAQEFLRYLVDGLHEGTNRVKRKVPYSELTYPTGASARECARVAAEWYRARQDSPVSDVFQGQLRSTLTCAHCGHRSLSFEPFWDLSLPLRAGASQLTLEGCLAHMAEKETLKGDEMPKCERCDKRRKCTKAIAVQALPDVLVLHLKRFRQDGYRRSKSTANVRFPLDNLDVSACCDPAAEEDGGSTLYSLHAVACHSGGLGAGHYTAMAKSPGDGAWRLYNDATVTAVDASRVAGSGAYVLFYHRVGDDRRRASSLKKRPPQQHQLSSL